MAPRIRSMRFSEGLPEGHTARSAAHRAVVGGVRRGNVLALARMLGHEDPSVTLKVYSPQVPLPTVNPQEKTYPVRWSKLLSPTR
jgi:hypothetical protein